MRCARARSRPQRQLFWGFALLIPLTVVAILVFSLRVGRPLRQIDRAISELGSGALFRPIDIRGPVDLAKLGRQLEWLRLRLLDLAQERNRFLRHMSHELKTPLANIREGTELLMDGAVGNLQSGQREVIGHPARQRPAPAAHDREPAELQRLADQQRGPRDQRVPAAAAGQADHREPAARAAVAARAAGRERRRPDGRGGPRQGAADPREPAVQCHQVHAAGGTIHMRARAAGNELVLEVGDSGPGIPPEERKHVFEAFYTGKAPGGHVKGTGIGLSVVLEFVTAHRGQIEIVDGEWPGAHFRIRMPLRSSGVARKRPDTGTEEAGPCGLAPHCMPRLRPAAGGLLQHRRPASMARARRRRPAAEAVQAAQLNSYSSALSQLVQGSPAEQAELMAGARAAYDRRGRDRPRCAMDWCWRRPAIPARDPMQAQHVLREALARPELLSGAERALAVVESQRVEAELRASGGSRPADRRAAARARPAAQRRHQRQPGAATADRNGRERPPAQGARRGARQARCHRQHRAQYLGPPARHRRTQTVNQPTRRKARILVVDDDPGLLRLLTIRLRAENYEVEAVESAAQALAATSRFRPDLVISDLRMEPVDGIGLLKELQNRWPGLKVILLTAHGTIPDAVQATQMGAFGFLTKPVDKQELLDQIQRALKISGFTDTTEEWRADIITRSAIMEERLAQAHMVAGTDARVLIIGESGTGKELLARAMHKASPRRAEPFVVASCATISEEQIDVDLFGADASTGQERPGAFQTADGGTLLLDEIGDLPARLQQKLLRALQEEAVRPVGSTTARPVNVRVISTTSATCSS